MVGARRVRPRFWANSDWVLAAAMLAIALLGLLQVYSATLHSEHEGAFARQGAWLMAGIVTFAAMSAADYRSLLRLSPALWAIVTLLLVSVLLFAEPVNGSRRWLRLGSGLHFQVSEFAKLVLLLVVARFGKAFTTGTLHVRAFFPVVPLFLAVFVLVVLQPDLSTSLSMLPLLAVALFLSKIPKRYFAVTGLAVLLLAPLAWSTLKPYQKDRIVGFLSPTDQPLGIGYQILQSRIAVGAGGLWGQGFAQGSQTQLRFLPTAHTDFVLASLAEERGFAGVTVVLSLYLLLLVRITETARTARNPEGMLLAMGVAALLLFHVLVNGGMVANKLPVTGLPLPLMSYGGSSLLTTMAMLGVVNSVRIRRFVN